MTSCVSRALRIIFCLLITGYVSGCASNMRYVQIGNMWTMGEIKKGEPVVYPEIWINPAIKKPMPQICLRLQDGQIVQLSSLTNKITIPADAVAIGREDDKIFYTPPFTLESLEHIFGHPDSVSDGYFH